MNRGISIPLTGGGKESDTNNFWSRVKETQIKTNKTNKRSQSESSRKNNTKEINKEDFKTEIVDVKNNKFKSYMSPLKKSKSEKVIKFEDLERSTKNNLKNNNVKIDVKIINPTKNLRNYDISNNNLKNKDRPLTPVNKNSDMIIKNKFIKEFDNECFKLVNDNE